MSTIIDAHSAFTRYSRCHLEEQLSITFSSSKSSMARWTARNLCIGLTFLFLLELSLVQPFSRRHHHTSYACLPQHCALSILPGQRCSIGLFWCIAAVLPAETSYMGGWADLTWIQSIKWLLFNKCPYLLLISLGLHCKCITSLPGYGTELQSNVTKAWAIIDLFSLLQT